MFVNSQIALGLDIHDSLDDGDPDGSNYGIDWLGPVVSEANKSRVDVFDIPVTLK